MSLSSSQAERLAREMEGYFELELYEQSLERARALIASQKCLVRAKFFAGECLKVTGQFQEAAHLLREVLASDPPKEYRKGALLGLGWCAKRLGRLDLAIRYLQRLCKQFPDEAIGPYNLACYYALEGRRDEVIRALRRAIRMQTRLRDLARCEEDFHALRSDPEFRRLLQEGGD